MQELSSIPMGKLHYYIRGCFDEVKSIQSTSPKILQEFVDRMHVTPEWYNNDLAKKGSMAFLSNADLFLTAFVTGGIVEGFSTGISKSFVTTGRIYEATTRRLRQNIRHLLEIQLPGGICPGGDGWKLTLRIRIIHAQIRRLINQSDEWDAARWGESVSAAHTALALTCFSLRVNNFAIRLGAKVTAEEQKEILDIWRYTGYLMGVPEEVLFTDENDARIINRIGMECEPPPEVESILMSNSIINSAPIVIGITDPSTRKKIANSLYQLSRYLIGNERGDNLHFPSQSSWIFMKGMAFKNRILDATIKRIPYLSSKLARDKFENLLNLAALDEGGIDYRLPDHVHAEKSSDW